MSVARVLDVRWRVLFVAGVAGALAMGLSAPASVIDPDLAVLLRFMAVVKLGMALGTAALALWRLMLPIRPGLAVSYAVAVCGMALGSGLIWQSAFVAGSAVLVHAGLLLFGLAAWRDRDGIAAGLSRAGRQTGRARGRPMVRNAGHSGSASKAFG